MRTLIVGLLILALVTGLAILHRRRKRRARALPRGARRSSSCVATSGVRVLLASAVVLKVSTPLQAAAPSR